MTPARLLLALLLLVAAVGTAAWSQRQRWLSQPAKTQAVSRDEQRVVTALGMLEPESKVIRIAGPPGARLDHLGENVAEGAVVSQGDALAFLDSHAEMQAARNLAASQWEEAKKLYQAETNAAQAAIDQAQLKVKQAEQVFPLEIEAHRAHVRRDQAELDEAQKDFNRIDRLFKGNSVSETAYDDAVLILRQAKEQLAKDQASLGRLEQDLPIQQGLARAGFLLAQATMHRNQLSAKVDSLERSLQMAEARLELTIIRAPISGEVLKISLQPGETLGAEPMLLMGNTGSMFVTVEVYETDVRHVRAGQTARITSPAFPEQLTGRVHRVSSLIHKNDLLHIDPTADTDARVLEVLIRLDESAVAARYNHHQVDVEIDIDQPAAAADAAGDSSGVGSTASLR